MNGNVQRGSSAQRIKEVAPLAVSMHCFLHREALATKEMEPSLHGVLDVAVKIVNFVKARATNSRLFTVLCEEVGADYHTLLMHTDVRWLSRGTGVDASVQPEGGVA